MAGRFCFVHFTNDSKWFTESFLSFVVFVAMSQIKLMGALADYIGAHRHALAPATACPLFRGAQQQSAGSSASFLAVHYQAIYFRSQFDFEQRRNADVQPANNFALGRFRDQYGVLVGRFNPAQSLCNRSRFCGITQLAAKLGDLGAIAALCAPDCDGRSFGCGTDLVLFFGHAQYLISFRVVILIGQNVFSESSKMVTGPSLTNSTDMVA